MLETGGCGKSNKYREFVDCSEFCNFGEAAAGETGGVGNAGDGSKTVGGGEISSRPTLISKLSRLNFCLKRINCED